MATLAVDRKRAYEFDDAGPCFDDLPVIAADIIYEGAAVGESTLPGQVRPLVAGDPFMGFAELQADNASGGASAITCKVRTRGRVRLAVTGVVIGTTLEGATVYASDDDTFTLTSAGNTAIGRIARFVTGTTCVVEFEAGYARSL